MSVDDIPDRLQKSNPFGLLAIFGLVILFLVTVVMVFNTTEKSAKPDEPAKEAKQ